MLDRWITRPSVGLARWFDGLENRFLALHDRPGRPKERP
jgi:hypothetical protein